MGEGGGGGRWWGKGEKERGVWAKERKWRGEEGGRREEMVSFEEKSKLLWALQHKQ